MEASPSAGRLYKDFPIEARFEPGTDTSDITRGESPDDIALDLPSEWSLKAFGKKFPFFKKVPSETRDYETIDSRILTGMKIPFTDIETPSVLDYIGSPNFLKKIRKQKTESKELERLRENNKFKNVFGTNWTKKKNINIPINVEEYFVKKFETEKQKKALLKTEEDDVTLMHMWPKEKNDYTYRKEVENIIRNKYIDDFDTPMLDKVKNLGLIEKYLDNNVSPEKFAYDVVQKVAGYDYLKHGKDRYELKDKVKSRARSKLWRFTVDLYKKTSDALVERYKKEQKGYEKRKEWHEKGETLGSKIGVGPDWIQLMTYGKGEPTAPLKGKELRSTGDRDIPRLKQVSEDIKELIPFKIPTPEGLMYDKEVRQKTKRDLLNAITAANRILFGDYDLHVKNAIKDITLKLIDKPVITATSGGLPFPVGPGLKSIFKFPWGDLGVDIDITGPGAGFMVKWHDVSRWLQGNKLLKNTYLHTNYPRNWKKLPKDQIEILRKDKNQRLKNYNKFTNEMKKTKGWLYYGGEIDFSKPPLFFVPMAGPTEEGDWIKKGVAQEVGRAQWSLLDTTNNIFTAFQGLTEKASEEIPFTNPYDPTQTIKEEEDIPPELFTKETD